jgi:1-acyl-sn-glycerol-3-phosphate acyltransferase
MTQPNTLSQDNRPKNYIGSTLLFIGIFSTATITGLLILLSVPFSFNLAYKFSSTWCGVVIWMSKIFCGLHYELEGLENIKNIKTAIVFSNHQSAWETLALRYILPKQVVLLKRSLQWFPIWGWALIPLKSIAIDRKKQRSAMRILLEQGAKRLKEGLWVVIYPEGTRSAPGVINKFSAGGAMLAQKTGFPVIPVVHNAGRYWPRYSFLKYPGVIKVKIGPVIDTQNRKANDINAEAEAWISQALKAIDADQ